MKTNSEILDRVLDEAEDRRKRATRLQRLQEWFNDNILWEIRYGIPNRISDKWYDLKYGVGSLISFFKTVWKFRPWDYTYCLDIFSKSLEMLRDNLIHETDITRVKRQEAITELIKCFDIICDMDDTYGLGSDFYDKVEAEGISADESYRMRMEARNKIYDRIAHLLKGQDYSKFRKRKGESDDDMFNRLFDGSGIEGWWD